MSSKITIEEAQAHLAELIASLIPGEEILIVKNEQPVAKLIAQPAAVQQPRQPGSARGKIIIHAEDDDHLKDF